MAELSLDISALIAAGLMDANGNWLVDPNTGQPTPTAQATNPDFAKINTDYFAWADSQRANGVSDAQFVQSADFKNWQQTVLGALDTTTNKADVSADLEYIKANINDPVYGEWFRTLAAAKQDRLDTLNNPLSPYLILPSGNTNKTDANLQADRDAIYAQAQGAYQSLMAFQKQQGDYIAQLTDEIRMQREFSIPRLPEKSGAVVAGGSSMVADQKRVALPDLLIRY